MLSSIFLTLFLVPSSSWGGDFCSLTYFSCDSCAMEILDADRPQKPYMDDPCASCISESCADRYTIETLMEQAKDNTVKVEKANGIIGQMDLSFGNACDIKLLKFVISKSHRFPRQFRPGIMKFIENRRSEFNDGPISKCLHPLLDGYNTAPTWLKGSIIVALKHFKPWYGKKATLLKIRKLDDYMDWVVKENFPMPITYEKKWGRKEKKLIRLLRTSDLKLIRNGIFANKGMSFEDKMLQSEFESTKWYKKNPDYSHEMLSETDKHNIALILREEKNR